MGHGGSNESCATVSHSCLSKGEYGVSELSSVLSSPSLPVPSYVAPVSQVKCNPAVMLAKAESHTKNFSKYANFQESELMSVSEKQKKRECRAVAAEVMKFFSDGGKLMPVPQRIYPDPQKVDRINALFFRPPLTQEQKNLDIWRKYGPSKIKIQKQICRKIAASVHSYHVQRALADYFQPKYMKTLDIVDKMIICSLIADEIKWFFKAGTQLRQTCRNTVRIYPDSVKVEKVRSFFFRPPVSQQQRKREILCNMGPLKVRTRKMVCKNIAICVNNYHFTKMMACFQEKIGRDEPSEADKYCVSSLIAGQVKEFFMMQSKLRHTIRVTRRIYPDPEKAAMVQSFFYRPMTQDQKNLEILRNMGPSRIRTQKKVCGTIAAMVQSHYFTKAMSLFQKKIKKEEPGEDDKINVSSFIAGEIKGFFMSRSKLRPRIRSGRIRPNPQKVAKVQAHFSMLMETQTFAYMDTSSVEYQKLYCRRIAVAVRSEIFGQACIHFQDRVKGRELETEEKMMMCCFIAGEIDGFYMHHDMFPELPKSCFPFH